MYRPFGRRSLAPPPPLSRPDDDAGLVVVVAGRRPSCADPARGQQLPCRLAKRNDFSALMAATAAGLRHPPPGAARGDYVTALTDFRTAGLDLRDNQVSAALVATQNGITADQKATTILTTQLGQCRH